MQDRDLEEKRIQGEYPGASVEWVQAGPFHWCAMWIAQAPSATSPSQYCRLFKILRNFRGQQALSEVTTSKVRIHATR